eukprot:CFRG6451T1
MLTDIDYKYKLDSKIAQSLGIVPLQTGHVPTRRHTGVQMATPTPLMDTWVRAYKVKEYPLLDLGAAYGINSFTAAMRGAHVVAYDLDKTHLEYIDKVWAIEKTHATTQTPTPGTITTMLGELPELSMDDPDLRFSGVLCSEVIHFLRSNQVQRAFQRMHDVLIPGGVLALTCAGVNVIQTLLDPEKHMESYQTKKRKNVPFPGEFDINLLEQGYLDKNRDFTKPDILQVFDVDTIRRAAETAGFEVMKCEYGTHPGYPAFVLATCTNMFTIHLIARRR